MLRAGTIIRAARRRGRLTQAELADRLGTSQAAVWRWEHGLVEPSFATLLRAASASGLAMSVALEDVDPDEWRLVEAGKERSPAQRLRDLKAYSRFVVLGRRAMVRARRGE